MGSRFSNFTQVQHPWSKKPRIGDTNHRRAKDGFREIPKSTDPLSRIQVHGKHNRFGKKGAK